ncbi:MAG: UDP-N-acetylmuramate--L-alanine ligase [Acidobacteriota bacterium]|jgi:UDP-N-acetylmuramate--alanine ligase
MFRRFTGLDRVHLVGIGGTGMSGIAEILLEYDVEVSGSDRARSETTERLVRLGATIDYGHDPEHVAGADLVVYSSAVPPDNPEVAEARRRGIAVVRRAEMLAELMRLKYGVAVAGTHGKTTTTSLIGAVLTESGLDPTVIVGGRVRALGTGARMGHSDYLVAEADEYDRSFLRLSPIIAVVTSIDADHLDTYRDLEEIEDAFVEFSERVPFFGQVLVCLDDPNVQEILPRIADRRVVTYGFSPQADFQVTEVALVERAEPRTRFVVRHASEGVLGTVELPLPGRHNVLNAVAAIAVGHALGVPFADVARALERFGGIDRRFERKGVWRGAVVVDDYAHHPAEVAATLAAARQVCPAGKIHAVFQPHLFTRTRDQAAAFGRALLGGDRVVVTDIYPSREQPIEGVTGELVVEAARASGHRRVDFCPDWADVPELLAPDVAAGDLVLTLGAGDVYRLAVELAGREQEEAS